jgi:MFS family permease
MRKNRDLCRGAPENARAGRVPSFLNARPESRLEPFDEQPRVESLFPNCNHTNFAYNWLSTASYGFELLLKWVIGRRKVSASLPRERFNVGLLSANQAIFGISMSTTLTLSGVVGARLAPDPALATLPIALMQICTLFATFPASMLMKRLGRRPGFLIGATAGGASGGLVSAIGIISESFLIFALGNMLLGIFQAFAMYYRFAAVDCASESFRSKAISLVLAGGVISAIFGPWNANYSQALIQRAPEAGPFLVLAGLAIIATILLGLLQVPDSREPTNAGPGRKISTIASQPSFIVALLAAAIGYGVMVLIMTATPIAMSREGYEIGQTALVMQAHVMGMFAPSFITGSLIARFGVLNILLTGGLLMFGAIGLALSGVALWQFIIALLLLGVGWNFLFIGGSTLLTETHTQAERGKIQGINDFAIFSLVALGSALSGVLLHNLGWLTLNMIAIPFIVVTVLATLWLRLNPTRRTVTTPVASADD